ncbi:MAG: tetratricopeptide repeat protein [Gemmatimonadota bacterium]
MKQLIHEIHRRSLWQVLGIYLAGSWLALQVVEQLTNAAGLPDWVQPLALALLVVGLPVVMATACVQEGIAGGETAAETAAAPRQSPAGEEAAAVPKGAADSTSVSGSGTHKLFTWRNAILGGVGAFAVLGALTAGYMAMRTMGIGPAGTLVAKGVLQERSRLILADFESDDPGLGRTATEAFRIDVSQSRVVRLTEPRVLAEAVRRMGRDPEAPLNPSLARELAQREGIPAVLSGAVNRAGSSYLVTAELVAATTGEVLASARGTALDSSTILQTIDELSESIRERIGESLRDLRADPSLEHVTTPSLAALQKYSLALRAYEVEGASGHAMALLEEAIALDSAFAMAHRKLGVILGNMGLERARRLRALTRAYELREHLTERERYLTVAAYHLSVTGEENQAILAYESLLDLDPLDNWALNNLATLHSRSGEDAVTEELLERALAADSATATAWMNLVDTRVAQGEFEEAEQTLAAAIERLPGNISLGYKGIELAAARLDWSTAEQRAASLPETYAGNPEADGGDDFNLAVLAGLQGRLTEAEAGLGRSAAAAVRQGRERWALNDLLDRAAIDIMIRQRPERGLARIDSVLASHPLSDLQALDRPYMNLAWYMANAGRRDRARELLDEYEAEVPESARRRSTDIWLPAHRAAVAIADGRPADALTTLRAIELRRPQIDIHLVLGLTYAAAGQPDSAIAEFERYLGTPDIDRLFSDWMWRARTLEQLGQLSEQVGDLDRAANYYAAFVELWAEADEELLPRVRAAQARLDEIVRARG